MPRLHAKHRTEIEYAGPVGESVNEIHLTPLTLGAQRVLSSTVRVEPGCDASSHRDSFGNTVHWFQVTEPHDRLVVEARALVETRPVAEVADAGPAMRALDDPAYRDAMAEFLTPSVHVRWPRAVRALLPRLELDGSGVAAWARSLEREVNRVIAYTPGVTMVDTPIEDVVRDRRGVCQDMAHLMLALCRARGVAARYVSGWLHLPGHDGPAESHAWVEVAIPGAGWHEYDPTHPRPALEHHVRLSVGRDYADVPPLRGSYVGPPTVAMRVSVEMSEVA